MTQIQKCRRGRPKGTGIDDRHTLALVAGILSTNPMSLTAAIRAAGVTDPSHIRRVRDKYTAASRKLMRAASDEWEEKYAHDGL